MRASISKALKPRNQSLYSFNRVRYFFFPPGKEKSWICLFPFGELDKSVIAHFRFLWGPISDRAP